MIRLLPDRLKPETLDQAICRFQVERPCNR